MDVALMVIGGGIAVIVLAAVSAWRTSSARLRPGTTDDAGPGYMYSGDAFSGDTTSTPDCGDTGGGSDSGGGCDGGGGDGGGGGGSD
jgi:hypothetical protein